MEEASTKQNIRGFTSSSSFKIATEETCVVLNKQNAQIDWIFDMSSDSFVQVFFRFSY
jgi:hypothetical protein